MEPGLGQGGYVPINLDLSAKPYLLPGIIEVLLNSGLAQAITVNNDLQKDRVVLDVVFVLFFDLLVFRELRPSETGVLFHLGPPQEWLILRAGVGFDAEFDMLPRLWILLLVQQIKSNSVVERPLQQCVISACQIQERDTVNSLETDKAEIKFCDRTVLFLEDGQ